MKLAINSKYFGFLIALFCSFVVSPQALAECYNYDDLGRLESVTYDNIDNAKSNYELDEHGNRETVSTTISSAVPCVAPDGITTGYQDGPLTTETVSDKPGDPSDNQDPTADDEDILMEVLSTRVVMPLEGDTDPDGDTLTIDSIVETSPLIDATLNGEAVTIISYSIAGAATITYTISDGNGGTAQGNINVTIEDLDIPDPLDVCFENGVWVICETDL